MKKNINNFFSHTYLRSFSGKGHVYIYSLFHITHSATPACNGLEERRGNRLAFPKIFCVYLCVYFLYYLYFSIDNFCSVLSVDVLADGVSNNVELLSSGGGDDSGELLLDALLISREDTETLKSLEGVSNDLASTSSVVVSGVTESLLLAVDVSKGANTEVSSQVNLSGDGGNSGVEPIGVFGGEVLTLTGLNILNPVGDLDLVVLLQVLSVGLDEVTSGDVSDGESVSVSSVSQHLYMGIYIFLCIYLFI